MRFPLLLSVAMAGLASEGCTGDIATGQEELGRPAPAAVPATPPVTPPGATAGPVAGPGVPPPPVAACSAPVRPGPTPMRRHTIVEYNNTVRDLLGEDSKPADSFLPEARIDGFSNNEATQKVTTVIANQYLAAAERLADKAVPRLPKLLGCDPAVVGEDACAATFVAQMGKRAYRRPLTTEERAVVMKVYHTGRAGSDFTNGIKLALQAILISPQFLYRSELSVPAAGQTVVRLDAWELATRLSYFFWATMPDETLFAAAESGKLLAPGELAAQARRLLADARAKDPVATFFRQWLRIEEFDHVEKDTKVFSAWSGTLRSALKREAELFLDEVFWRDGGSIAALLSAPYSFRNATLAKFYGDSAPPAAVAGTTDPYEKVATDPAKRAGLMMQAGFNALLSPPEGTNPVIRGKEVREVLLCGDVPPPPPDVAAVAPKSDPKKPTTTRERFIEHSEAPICAGCHKMMDPIGLAFENYDGIGRWRDTENGRVIDVSGDLVGTDVDGPFKGVAGLAAKLSGAATVRSCVVTNVFRYAFGRTDTVEDRCAMAQLDGRLAAAKGGIKQLLLELVESEAFVSRVVSPVAQGVQR